MNATKLAELSGVSRTHLSEALAGRHGRGGTNLKRVVKCLKEAELVIVPRGTMSHVGQ
jgi:hypothetical protein